MPQLQVTVCGARALPQRDPDEVPKIFVIMQYSKQKFATKQVDYKSSVVWNEQCHFEISPPYNIDRPVILKLVEKNTGKVGGNIFRGQVRLTLDDFYKKFGEDTVFQRKHNYPMLNKKFESDKDRGTITFKVSFQNMEDKPQFVRDDKRHSIAAFRRKSTVPVNIHDDLKLNVGDKPNTLRSSFKRPSGSNRSSSGLSWNDSGNEVKHIDEIDRNILENRDYHMNNSFQKVSKWNAPSQKPKLEPIKQHSEYAKMSKEELCNLLTDQQQQIKDRDDRIQNLEDYVDRLCAKIIHINPDLLQNDPRNSRMTAKYFNDNGYYEW